MKIKAFLSHPEDCILNNYTKKGEFLVDGNV